jgi:hypothetical protein
MGDNEETTTTTTTPDPELERLRTENATTTRALALATTRLDFPKADPTILETFQGSPEGLRAMAEKLHAKELEREAALAAAHSTSTTPASTPGPGSSTTADEAAAAEYRTLKIKVLGRYAEPHEVERFNTLAFAQGWNNHQAERRAATRGGTA